METLRARRDEVAQAEAAVQALRADVQRERDEIELLLDRRSVLLSQIRNAEQRLGETQSPAGELEPPSVDQQ
jgi:chromosome segregation ATPase